MSNLYGLNNINEDVLETIQGLSNVSPVCKDYVFDPALEKGEKIIELMAEIDKNLMKVKRNIVRMLSEMEDKDDVIDVIPSNDGFQIQNLKGVM